nr:hypothetical protein [Pseudarthrobacter sp. NamE2]
MQGKRVERAVEAASPRGASFQGAGGDADPQVTVVRRAHRGLEDEAEVDVVVDVLIVADEVADPFPSSRRKAQFEPNGGQWANAAPISRK